MEEDLLKKAARDLTQQEAFELMIFLVEQGGIDLGDPVKTDDEGNITSLQPGQQVKIRTTLAGVDFYKAQDLNPGANGSASATQQASFSPTPAFAVVLYRLARWLVDKWQVTKIVYGGIGSGGGRNATDCHMTGHCVDFYGATARGGKEFDVRRDWYRRPVYRKDNGKQHARSPDVDDRWVNDTDTYFRLAVSPEHDDLLPGQFFADVYEFITKECTLGVDVAADVFRSGGALKSGTVMHPDYPVAGDPGPGRRTHNDHIHFQLGGAYE